MISTAKADRLIANLKERLNFRFADQSLSCVSSRDTDGFPMLILSDGTPATTEKVILIKIAQVDMISKDIFGNSTNAYTPHVLQLAYEDLAVLVPADFIKVMTEVGKLGIQVQVYKAAAGAPPATTDLVPSKLQADLEFDVLWPTKGM